MESRLEVYVVVPTWYPEAVNSLSIILAWSWKMDALKIVPEAVGSVHIYVGEGTTVLGGVDITEIVRAWGALFEIPSRAMSIK